MPSFSARRTVPYSAEQMYALVADVERYPEFIALCREVRVLSRAPAELLARMTVAYQALHESYTSRVTLDPAGRAIHVAAVDGPFRTLTNDWRFEPSATGCTVHFTLDYAFRSRMLGMVMGTLFDRAFAKFSDAFIARAHALYGRDTAASSSVSAT